MNRQQPGGGGGGQGDNSLDFLWVVAIIVLFGAFAWYFAKDHIINFVFAVRLYEIYLVTFVLNAWGKLATLVHLPAPDLQELNNWVYFILIYTEPTAETEAKARSDHGGHFIAHISAPAIWVSQGGQGYYENW